MNELKKRRWEIGEKKVRNDYSSSVLENEENAA
jgi:hypothetical protein